MELNPFEICQKHFIALHHAHENVKAGLFEAKSNVQILLNRNVRLSASLHEGWERNIAMELTLKSLRMKMESNERIGRTLLRTRRDIKELKQSTLMALNDIRSDLHSASQHSKDILRHLNSHINPAKSITHENIGEIQFTAYSSTTTDLDEKDYLPIVTSHRKRKWMLSEEQLHQWYVERANSKIVFYG